MKRGIFITFIMAIVFASLSLTVSAANTTLEGLKSKFPDGKYWNSGNADTYTSSPCTHHTPSWVDDCDIYGTCGCTFFDGIQCNGFARKVTYDYYGSQFMSWRYTTDTSSIKAGDVIYIDYFHYAWVISRDGNTLTLAECNYYSPCQISWGRTISIPLTAKVYIAPYEIDYNTTPSSTPTVDTSTGKTIISWSDEYSAEKYNVRIKDSNGVSYDIWNVIEKNIQIVLPVGQYTVYIDYIKGSEYTKGTSTEFNVSSVYNGPTTSELYADTSGNSVNFTWNKSINAQGYNIRIVDVNGTDYSLWNQTETYASVVLPLGTYYAYVDSYKGDEVTKGKKICFTVTQSYLDIEAVTPSVSVNDSTVHLIWKKAKNATAYSVRIKKSDGTAYDIWSITDTTADIVLPKGAYSVYIDSVNDYGFKGGNTVDFVVAETIITLKTAVSKKENTYTINTGLYNIDTSCDVLVACYKGGRLVTVENRTYSKENETFTATGDIDEIKVMLWDSLSTMRPLCNAEIINSDKFITE